MTNYENSVIYKLKRNDDYDDLNIYIGSTANYKNRKYAHKKACCNENDKSYNYPVYQFIRDNGGWDMWAMLPIETIPCENKRELEIRERYHIDLLRPTLNKHIPTRNMKEWYENNKEQILEKAKERYENNRKDILEKQKEYQQKNKEQIAEREKQYRENNREKISEGMKQYYQNNREEKLEKVKQYQQNNEEKIAAKKKQYYQNNKEKLAAQKKQYYQNKKNKQDKDNNLSHEILEHELVNEASVETDR